MKSLKVTQGGTSPGMASKCVLAASQNCCSVNTGGLDGNRRLIYKQARAQTSGPSSAASDTVQVQALWPARCTV
jgi:hypothetical protein